MSENARKRRSYNQACELVYELVVRWKPRAPDFVFPPRDIAFVAGLDDVGEYLARNDAARELLAALISESRRRLGEAPTVMMLRAALELQQIPFALVPFAELGIEVTLYPIRSGPPGPDTS